MPDFLTEHPIAAPVAAVSAVLTVFGYINDAYSLVAAGLPNSVWQAIGSAAFFVSTGAIVFRHHRVIQRTIPGAAIGGGPNPARAAPTQSAAAWNDEAHLTLVFDKAIKNAIAVVQENVPFYHWYHHQGVEVDCDKVEMRPIPGSVIVFLSLKEPTHTNYNRVYVVGGGFQCELLGHNAAGAVAWASGNLSGCTLDIRFSKTPIP
jgi:hypothetical protein